MNMTNKLAFLTILLLTFNVSASSRTANTLIADEQTPDWSHTFVIPQHTLKGAYAFPTVARNHVFITFRCRNECVIFQKKRTPIITFKKGEKYLGLTLLEDCALNFKMSQEEFSQALFNSFQVTMF